MTLISTIWRRLRPNTIEAVNAPLPLVCDPAEMNDPAAKKLQETASRCLDEQIHQLIDRNADGVNRLAMRVRRDSDLLLSLGISDPYAAKAGTLAQFALEMANGKRGMNIEAVAHTPSVSERKDLVVKAMSLASRAEALLNHAKSVNAAAIEVALATQARLLREVATSSYAPLLVSQNA